MLSEEIHEMRLEIEFNEVFLDFMTVLCSYIA